MPATAQSIAEVERIRAAADLVRIAEQWNPVQRVGTEHKTLCPFHDDHSPSLTLFVKDGIQYYKCFSCGAGGDVFNFVGRIEGISEFPKILERVAEYAGMTLESRKQEPAPVRKPAPIPVTTMPNKTAQKLIDTYRYLDADGNLVYEVQRYEHYEDGNRKKTFRQRRVGADGRMENKAAPTEKRVLYNLPAILTPVPPPAKPLVLVVEGEKDANALIALGYVATTVSGGAKQPWLPQYTEALRGKNVAVFQDNDEPGREHALKICKALHGNVAKLKLMPPVPEGKDVADWLAAGATKADINQILVSTPVWEPPLEEPEPVLEPVDARTAIREAIDAEDIQAVYDLARHLAALEPHERIVLERAAAAKFGRDFDRREFRKRAGSSIAASSSSLPVVPINMMPPLEAINAIMGHIRQRNSAALDDGDTSGLFTRAGRLVHVRTDEDGRPSILPVDTDYIRSVMTRAVACVKVGEKGDSHVYAPRDLATDLLQRPLDEWNLPRLTGIMESPTMRPDGTIFSRAGYDPVTGLMLLPGADLAMPDVPEDPCADDIDAARAVIEEPFADFPIVSDADRANLMGLLVTMVIRPSIRGCVPLALIDAPDAGTGKSLLADALHIIATGRKCKMTPPPATEEEWRKQIPSSLLSGAPVIVWDNVDSLLNSPTLALALTSEEIEVRILGKTENVSAPVRAVMIATGNNIRPSGDLPRRCYRIRMDAGKAHPYMDRSFRIGDLKQFCSENRPRLLHAVLTLARAWALGGRKPGTDKLLGSFEPWHSTVSGILAVTGIDSFLANRSDMLEQDEDAQQWERFLVALADRWPDGQQFSAQDILDACQRQSDNDSGLRQMLPDFLAEAYAKTPELARRKLGHAFSRRRDQKYGPDGWMIRRRASRYAGTTHYCVERAGVS